MRRGSPAEPKGSWVLGFGGRRIFEKAEKGGLSRGECSMKKRRKKSRVFVLLPSLILILSPSYKVLVITLDPVT